MKYLTTILIACFLLSALPARAEEGVDVDMSVLDDLQGYSPPAMFTHPAPVPIEIKKLNIVSRTRYLGPPPFPKHKPAFTTPTAAAPVVPVEMHNIESETLPPPSPEMIPGGTVEKPPGETSAVKPQTSVSPAETQVPDGINAPDTPIMPDQSTLVAPQAAEPEIPAPPSVQENITTPEIIEPQAGEQSPGSAEESDSGIIEDITAEITTPSASSFPPEDTADQQNPGQKNDTPSQEELEETLHKMLNEEPPRGAFTLEFSPQQVEIPAEDFAPLETKVIEPLQDNKDWRVEIRGYASPEEEGRSMTRRISLARTIALRDALIKKNISPDRIDVRALGQTTNETPLDRVDVVFIKPEQ